MNSRKLAAISKAIKKRLETTPGIVSFVSMIDNKNKDDENSWIQINHEEGNNIEVSIAIAINRNVTTLNLSKEIYEAIFLELKNLKLTLKKLNFYVRGVK